MCKKPLAGGNLAESPPDVPNLREPGRTFCVVVPPFLPRRAQERTFTPTHHNSPTSPSRVRVRVCGLRAFLVCAFPRMPRLLSALLLLLALCTAGALADCTSYNDCRTCASSTYFGTLHLTRPHSLAALIATRALPHLAYRCSCRRFPYALTLHDVPRASSPLNA